MPPLPARHIELEWAAPDEGRWLELLARGRTLVQYDPRGLGLSDRAAIEYSLAALERDLDAVVERTAPDGVALFAAVNSGALALAYAAHHPERVSHLILWCCTPRGMEGIGQHLDALLGLVDRDWELATETAAHLLRGWSSGEAARRFAIMLRACASPEATRALARVASEIDVSGLLAAVRAPTLVLHRRGLSWIPIERAVELASGIPGAQLVTLEGDSMAPWAGDTAAIVRAVDEFLGVPPADEPVPSAANVFRREGEYWTLAFDGRLARLRDGKGLHHIAYLLARPGESVPAVELLGSAPEALGDAGPVLDAEAKQAYRQRLTALRAELGDAETANDIGRAAAVREEIERLAEQLSAAVGLGGRDRRIGATAERARLTVTKRIKDALARIDRAESSLGAYLGRTIRTGLLCMYAPDAGDPVRWSL
jgi:pimeloyl-ACP methyl ester carboxylesterase